MCKLRVPPLVTIWKHTVSLFGHRVQTKGPPALCSSCVNIRVLSLLNVCKLWVPPVHGQHVQTKGPLLVIICKKHKGSLYSYHVQTKSPLPFGHHECQLRVLPLVIMCKLRLPPLVIMCKLRVLPLVIMCKLRVPPFGHHVPTKSPPFGHHVQTKGPPPPLVIMCKLRIPRMQRVRSLLILYKGSSPFSHQVFPIVFYCHYVERVPHFSLCGSWKRISSDVSS